MRGQPPFLGAASCCNQAAGGARPLNIDSASRLIQHALRRDYPCRKFPLHFYWPLRTRFAAASMSEVMRVRR